jgi:hypothetical protein
MTLKIIHTYHSRFIPEGVLEAPQIAIRNIADLTGGKPIAVRQRPTQV